MASPLQEYRATQGTKNKVISPLQQYRATQGGSTAPASPLSRLRPTRSGDTKTSEGLYNLAVQNGLQADADRLIARQSGESVNKIFSGGFISDIFDTLNMLQYGVTGVLKGKSFMEGVKTRQSFSDKDALGEFGVPGVIGGIAADIAVDPLTYISLGSIPVIKHGLGVLGKVGKVIKDFAIGKKVFTGVDTGTVYKTAEEAVKSGERVVEGLQGGTKVGGYITSKLAYSIGRDPVFMKTYERSIRNIAVTTQEVVNFGKAVAKLTPDIAKQIVKVVDNQGRLGRVPFAELAGKLTPDQLAPVAKLYNYIDNLGKEAVDLGLLSKEKFEENIGEYMKNAYNEFETAKNKLPFGYSTTGVKGIKNRVDELSEALKADRIENPAYLLMKSAIDLKRDVENAKLFKETAQRFGRDTAAEGFVQMPKTARVGELAGKFVPAHMADYLNEVVKPATTGLQELERKVVGNFKFFKVVMNPATHARNIMSNMVLNYWKLGMNPLDPRVIKAQGTALREIAKGAGKWSDEARPLGYSLNTFATAEMKGLLDSPEAAAGMAKFGKGWETIKTKLGDLYQGEENFAKLTAYIFQREVKKMNPEDAWKAAESATFNYAQVTPFIRKLRESLFGFPFITFTYKATPLAIETALKNPQRIGVIGKIKQGIEEQADLEVTERERQAEPPWVKDGFYIKWPYGEDSEGRSIYIDMTYILPFGDLVSGNFFDRGTNMKTGTPEQPGVAALSKSPFLNLVKELGTNQNFYGKQIARESDSTYKQMTDLMMHIGKTYAPPLVGDLVPGGYNEDGTRDVRGMQEALTPNAEADMKRTATQELLRNFGVKVQPINVEIQEQYQDWNKQKALKTLLRERGIIDDLNITYVPDEKK